LHRIEAVGGGDPEDIPKLSQRINFSNSPDVVTSATIAPNILPGEA
jgi:hypothetical protein